MKLPRLPRYIAALVAVVSMLLMQFAVAAYVCPGAGTGDSQMASIDYAGMPGCDGMDTAQPTLCHANAHDHAGKQSIDKPELPQVQAFSPVGLTQIVGPSDIVSASLSAESTSLLLTRTTAPPIAIRNCCFRI